MKKGLRRKQYWGAQEWGNIAKKGQNYTNVGKITKLRAKLHKWGKIGGGVPPFFHLRATLRAKRSRGVRQVFIGSISDF